MRAAVRRAGSLHSSCSRTRSDIVSNARHDADDLAGPRSDLDAHRTKALAQPILMTARPVNAPAFGTAREGVEAFDNAGWNFARLDRPGKRVGAGRPQFAVAPDAARKRLEQLIELEAVDHLAYLFQRFDGVNVSAVRDAAVLEQAGIARQDDAVFVPRSDDDVLVGEIVGIQAVEAKRAQVACQPAEVHVQDEARIAQRRRSQSGNAGHVEGFEYRIYRNPLGASKQVAEACRSAVDQHQVHLGVWHAQ